VCWPHTGFQVKELSGPEDTFFFQLITIERKKLTAVYHSKAGSTTQIYSRINGVKIKKEAVF
jgi:hypothetical protein